MYLDYIGIVVLWHGTVDSRQPLQPGSDAKVDSFAPRQRGSSPEELLICNLAYPHLLFETIAESPQQGQIECFICRVAGR